LGEESLIGEDRSPSRWNSGVDAVWSTARNRFTPAVRYCQRVTFHCDVVIVELADVSSAATQQPSEGQTKLRQWLWFSLDRFIYLQRSNGHRDTRTFGSGFDGYPLNGCDPLGVPSKEDGLFTLRHRECGQRALCFGVFSFLCADEPPFPRLP
jgi:hypothetical protein